MKKPNVNKFYLRFEDESIEDAVDSHGNGFHSIEEAIKEAAYEPGKYKIYNHELNVVYTGEVLEA